VKRTARTTAGPRSQRLPFRADRVFRISYTACSSYSGEPLRSTPLRPGGLVDGRGPTHPTSYFGLPDFLPLPITLLLQNCTSQQKGFRMIVHPYWTHGLPENPVSGESSSGRTIHATRYPGATRITTRNQTRRAASSCASRASGAVHLPGSVFGGHVWPRKMDPDNRQHPDPVHSSKAGSTWFESQFKADIYYVNTRLFTGNKWGTANPVIDARQRLWDRPRAGLRHHSISASSTPSCT